LQGTSWPISHDVDQTHANANHAGAKRKTGSTRYLTFRVARKDFAMEAACVRGILPLHELVPVHGARPDVAGFASLGGRMLAVLDLGVRLNLPYATRGSQPKIVVAEHPGGALAGFIADRVSDVVTYRSRDLRNGVLHGLGRPRRLIDLNALAAGDELAQLTILAR